MDLPTTIDRYRIRRRMGEGRGVIYVAHDPDLDREVALELLPMGADDARLRREAQALAKLSHPNVVAVYDVGEYEGQTFVARALVDGVSFRQWLSAKHTSREVLDVLCAAARGLIAIHAAGLVHRTLGPDAIFVANTGAVLVGDVASELDQDATELSDQLAFSERSDQLAFCVMAQAAMSGHRIDASVERALARGACGEPAERWDSMSELLRAIEPRARTWPWLVAAGAAVGGAAVVTMIVATREPVASAADICATAGAPAWNALTRGALEAALRAQGNTPDAIAELGRRLDDYATNWTTVRRDACIERVFGRLSPPSAILRDACLDTRKTMFQATTASLHESNDVFTTWRRVAMIPAPEACTDEDTARLSSASSEHQALMRELAFAVNQNSKAIAEVARKAELTTDLPARLEIALAQAVDALDNTRLNDADAALERARTLAEQIGVQSLRVRAFALSARSFCIQARTAEAEQFLAMAQAGAQRLHDSEIDEVLQARSECLYRRAQYAELEPLLLERIARVQRRFGRDGMEESNLRHRLGLLYVQLGRAADAAREYNASQRIEKRFVKADEQTATDEQNRSLAAMQTGDIDAAIFHARRAIEMLTAVQSPDLVNLGRSLIGLGSVLETGGESKAANVAYSDGLALLPIETADEDLAAKRVEGLESRGWVRLDLGDADAGIADLQTAVVEGQRIQRADYVTSSQIGLARAWVMKREYARAVRLLRTWLEPYEKSANRSTYRVGIAKFAFAQALWETGDRTAASTFARDAQAMIADSLHSRRENPVARYLVARTEVTLASVTHWRDEHR